MKRFCQTILNKAQSWRGAAFRGAPMDLPGTRVPVAACLRRMWLIVAQVKSTWPPIAHCCMPSWTSASTLCLIPIGALSEQSVRIEKICNWWFELATVPSQVWWKDHLSCGFGLQRSQLALKWKSPKVGSDFDGQLSHVHFTSISAHWKHKKSIHVDFIASNGGVAFSRSVFQSRKNTMFYTIYWYNDAFSKISEFHSWHSQIHIT